MSIEKSLGQLAYEAYGDSLNWKTPVQEDSFGSAVPMRQWETLPETFKEAWFNVVDTILTRKDLDSMSEKFVDGPEDNDKTEDVDDTDQNPEGVLE